MMIRTEHPQSRLSVVSTRAPLDEAARRHGFPALALLTQAPEMGARAVWLPYNGYLHPRPITTWRQEAGFAQRFWCSPFGLGKHRSVRCFHPAGDIHMQLASNRRTDDDTLRLAPSQSPGKIVVRDIQLVCLGGTTN